MNTTNKQQTNNEQVTSAIKNAVLKANASNIAIIEACKKLASDVVLTFELF